jgi:hypothetical protein
VGRRPGGGDCVGYGYLGNVWGRIQDTSDGVPSLADKKPTQRKRTTKPLDKTSIHSEKCSTYWHYRPPGHIASGSSPRSRPWIRNPWIADLDLHAYVQSAFVGCVFHVTLPSRRRLGGFAVRPTKRWKRSLMRHAPSPIRHTPCYIGISSPNPRTLSTPWPTFCGVDTYP